jgi:PhoPQ-activated pathogenicity-related protein
MQVYFGAETMEAALIAALAALMGLAVGRLWDTRSETARWRRDQRIRVYEGLATAYYQVREAIRALAMCEPGTAAADQAEIRVYEVAAQEWNQQVVATWLHGSPLVIPTVERLDRLVVTLFLDARARRYTWEEFQEER